MMRRGPPFRRRRETRVGRRARRWAAWSHPRFGVTVGYADRMGPPLRTWWWGAALGVLPLVMCGRIPGRTPVPVASARPALAASAASAPIAPPVVEPKWSAEAAIDAAFAEAIASESVPGGVVLVGRHDRVVFRRAYGFRELEPERAATTPDTVFDSGLAHQAHRDGDERHGARRARRGLARRPAREVRPRVRQGRQARHHAATPAPARLGLARGHREGRLRARAGRGDTSDLQRVAPRRPRPRIDLQRSGLRVARGGGAAGHVAGPRDLRGGGDLRAARDARHRLSACGRAPPARGVDGVRGRRVARRRGARPARVPARGRRRPRGALLDRGRSRALCARHPRRRGGRRQARALSAQRRRHDRAL